MLERCKRAMRIKTDAYDAEITDLIEAALADLGLAGIQKTGADEAEEYPLVRRAVVT